MSLQVDGTQSTLVKSAEENQPSPKPLPDKYSKLRIQVTKASVPVIAPSSLNPPPSTQSLRSRPIKGPVIVMDNQRYEAWTMKKLIPGTLLVQEP